MQQAKRPVVLIVLDGWGHREEHEHNAIALARTPAWDKFASSYPHALLSASGLDVGLPAGQMGNSEVGHMAMGAGRVIFQDLTKINLAIADGSFLQNPVLNHAMLTTAANPDSALHIMGLLSPGGIHSHEEQIYALIKLAAARQRKNVYVHAFLDGRDTPPKSAASSLQALTAVCQASGAEVASICGRYYAMDRDKKYARTKLAYDLLTTGQAEFAADTALAGLELAYARGESDEFVQPTIITTRRNPAIKDGDTVVYMNFRADRTKQLSYSLTQADFTGFARANVPKLQSFVTLTEYATDLAAEVAFPKQALHNVLGEYLAKHNLTQLRIAETEKYAHVTFFFNGGMDSVFPGETRDLIASPNVATYDLTPAMSAKEVTSKLLAAIASQQYDVIICNLANADMIGHTGNTPAAIAAIETLDQCLADIIDQLLKYDGEALITADHGNAELMYDTQTGQAHTAHTNSLVPFIYIGKRSVQLVRDYGTLSDVAPSLLTLLGLAIPEEMTGKTLLKIN